MSMSMYSTVTKVTVLVHSNVIVFSGTKTEKQKTDLPKTEETDVCSADF